MHMCRDVDDEVRAEAQRGYTRPPRGTDLDSCAWAIWRRARDAQWSEGVSMKSFVMILR